MKYNETPLFLKDLRQLQKRFRTLSEDLETAKVNAIELCHERSIDNESIFEIPGYRSDDCRICKIKKFTCKSMKGRGNRSGIRVIYAFYPQSMTVEFVEIYFKADQKNEDRERIKAYLADIKK